MTKTWVGWCLVLMAAGCGTFDDVSEVIFVGEQQPEGPVVACGDRAADRCALSLSQGSGSGFHQCAQMADGSLRCWGSNIEGQLGDGARRFLSVGPLDVLAPGSGQLVQVSTGGNFTCVLDDLGRVACVGGNEVGQLGSAGSGGPFETDFQLVEGVSGAAQIDAGGGFACALTSGGGAGPEVWCWGLNDKGQLGPEGVSDGSARQVPMPEGVTPEELMVGGDHACITSEGTIWCWGSNRHLALGREAGTNTEGCQTSSMRCLDGFDCDPCPGFVADLHDVTEVAAGARHTCAIDEGVVYCWGDNSSGQLGVLGPEARGSFVEVGLLRQDGVVIDALAAGDGHTCGRAGEQVYCWGANGNGQLGGECNVSIVTEPILIPGSANTGTLAMGANFSCGSYDSVGEGNEELWCWGDNSSGQLGDGTVEDNCTPVDGFPVGFDDEGGERRPLNQVTQFDAGGGHVCALLGDRRLMCWGDNASGQLGQGIPLIASTPVTVAGLSGLSGVAVGAAHTCAVSLGGKVMCWGDNSLGQLGQPGASLTNSPGGAVERLIGASAAIGDEHSCVLTPEGAVHCWGYNNFGALGDPSFALLDVVDPEPVLTGVQRLVSGAHHVCAVIEGGRVMCWGDNDFGQIGVEGQEICQTGRPCVLEPVEVAGVQGVRGLALGRGHTCAVIEGGRVMCWGANDRGQLGLGVLTETGGPEEIPGLAGVVGISAGAVHTCAFDAEGRVMCWGSNNDAQLGYDDDDSRCNDCQSSPRRLLRPLEVVQIISGAGHTCALQSGGGVQCWGGNVVGQLGAGSTAFTSEIQTVEF